MIRAIPSHIRWTDFDDKIYRFQLLEFDSNDTRSLMLEETRRQMSLSGGFKKATPKSHHRDSGISSICESAPRSRKSSVVQLKRNDDISGYQSDYDETDGYAFATVCYVDACSIKRLSRLSFSEDNNDSMTGPNKRKKLQRSLSLKEETINPPDLRSKNVNWSRKMSSKNGGGKEANVIRSRSFNGNKSYSFKRRQKTIIPEEKRE